MSSITSDILRIIHCAGADPTFTEIFARLSYATHTEVRDTLRGLERKGLIVSYYCPSMHQHRYYLSAQAEHLMNE
jgi:hypothetical protein